MAKKLLILLFLLASSAGICNAEYELRLTDGVILIWPSYSVERDQYCTDKEFGKFCILKRDVAAIKEIRSASSPAREPQRLNRAAPKKAETPELIHGIPVTGMDAPGVDLFDDVMVNAMRRIGCSAATLAIAERGTMVYSRGYGWRDMEKKVPTQPDTMIGIASCEKPVTAAAVKQLARDGLLNLDAGLFALLQVKPRGPVRDGRMNTITLRHLLEHKAGWGSDPASGAAVSLRKNGAADPLPIEALLSLVIMQPLKHDPGTVAEYCNFGFGTLRHVLEKFSDRRTDDYFRNVLFKPDQISGFYRVGSPLFPGSPPLVWNAESGGPISASAPALLRFMHRYWLTGEPRDSGNPLWVMYGSLDGSTAIMVWRPDGIDLVALFNGRSSVTHDEISRDIQAIVDRLKERLGGSLQP